MILQNPLPKAEAERSRRVKVELRKFSDARSRVQAKFEELTAAFPKDMSFSDGWSAAPYFQAIIEDTCREVGLSSSRFYEMLEEED